MDHVEEINVTLHVYKRHTRLVHARVQFFFIGVGTRGATSLMLPDPLVTEHLSIRDYKPKITKP